MARTKKSTETAQYEIWATADYGQFVMHDARDVNESRLNNLLEAVKQENLLQYYPIQVTSKGKDGKRQVLDGNRRLAVSMELKEPVYFMECDTANPATMALAVGRMDKWTLEDFLYYWTAEDSESHHQALLFMGAHGGLSAATAVQLLTGHVRRDPGVDLLCKKGTLEITHTAWATEVCNEVETIIEYASQIRSNQLLYRAFAVLYANPQFSLRNWQRKIQSQATIFSPQRTIADYFHMMRNAYNVGLTYEAQIADKDFRRRDLEPVSRAGAQLKTVNETN